ncbi:unnamed protein product [Euphydryas editha]|uniref:THAP9-like helix-turn-helix domain-containing protein n=1 Tax=Euphydryas editha TaxID=104508 RepID=A0AAU9TSC4_EUPED|nr:unnamed protein product [Euphydryas editha]
MWKSVLSEDIKNKGNSYIHGNVRLCGKHFEQKYHTRVLTSEKINYIKESSKLKVKLLKAQEKCKTLAQRLRKAENFSKNSSFIKAIEKLPDPALLFTKMQLQYMKKPRGRRFFIEEKILALTIYKQSQKAYNLMRKLFVLPSKRSLQKILNLIPLKPGINEFVFENLKKTVAK